MAIPGGVIRSNPFVQNDKRMLTERVRVSDSFQRFTSLQDPAPRVNKMVLVTSRNSFINESSADCAILSSSVPASFANTPVTPEADSNDNEITYGPGIVQKLRLKFSKMSNVATKSAQISPHSKRKRFPSVDDILSDNDHQSEGQISYRTDSLSLGNLSARSEMAVNSLPYQTNEVVAPLTERSSSQLNVEKKSRPEVENEVIPRPQNLFDEVKDDEVKKMPISALREKFERSSRRREPSTSSRSTVQALISRRGLPRSRSAAPYVEDSDEPEFVRVQRRLRRRGSHDAVQAGVTPTNDSVPSSVLSPIDNIISFIEEKKPTTPHSLPILKGTARVIVESSKEEEWKTRPGPPVPVRVSELISPPDPDSARQSLSALSEPILSSHYSYERSPPPEEPKPMSLSSLNDVEMQNRINEQDSMGGTVITVSSDAYSMLSRSLNMLSSPSLNAATFPNDGSGLNEMHNLVSKFNTSRDHKFASDVSLNNEFSHLSDVPETPKTPLSTPQPQTISSQTPLGKPFEFSKNTNPPQRKVEEKVNRPNSLMKQSALGSSFFNSDDSVYRSTIHSIEPRVFSPVNDDFLLMLSPSASIRPFDDNSFRNDDNSGISQESSGPRPESAVHRSVPVVPSAPLPVPSTPSVSSAVSSVAERRSSGTERRSSGSEEKTFVPSEPAAASSRVEFSRHQGRDDSQTVATPVAYPRNTVSTSFGSGPTQFVSPSTTTPIRTAPPVPATEQPSMDNTQRKSLTTRFLESKQQLNTNNVTDAALNQDVKPGTTSDTDSINTSERSETHSVQSNGSVESDGINRPSSLQYMIERFSRQRVAADTAFEDDHDIPDVIIHNHSSFASLTAGDGNPVRHSLINLVMEEDVPMLMEAMAEQLNFVFEDVASTPSSSGEGIIHNTIKRQQRRKLRNVSRINFTTTPPKVFAYPDETTALQHTEWQSGQHISYDQYQKICDNERDLLELKKQELKNWQAAIFAGRTSIDPEEAVSAKPDRPSDNDFCMGVTSRISYDSPPAFANTNDFLSSPVSLIAGK